MPSTRSKKREKEDPVVEEVKEEPEGKKKKTKDVAVKDKEKEEKAAQTESGSSKNKGKKETAEVESGKEDTAGGSVTQIVRITVEACNS